MGWEIFKCGEKRENKKNSLKQDNWPLKIKSII